MITQKATLVSNAENDLTQKISNMKNPFIWLLVFLIVQLQSYGQKQNIHPYFKGNLHEYLNKIIVSSVHTKFFSLGDPDIFTNVHFRIDRKGAVVSVHCIPAVDSGFTHLLTKIIKSTSLYWNQPTINNSSKDSTVLMILPVVFRLPAGPSNPVTATQLLSKVPSLKQEEMTASPQLQQTKGFPDQPQLCILLPVFEYRFIH